MITYWIAAKRPMGSKTWTLHPETVISTTYWGAEDKLKHLVTIPEDEWRLAMALVPEHEGEQWNLVADMIAKACREYAAITMQERESKAEHCLRDLIYTLTAADGDADEHVHATLAAIAQYFGGFKPDDFPTQRKPSGANDDTEGTI